MLSNWVVAIAVVEPDLVDPWIWRKEQLVQNAQVREDFVRLVNTVNTWLRVRAITTACREGRLVAATREGGG